MLKGTQALMHAIETGQPEPTNEAQRKELSAEWQRTGSAETLAKLEAVEAKHTPGPWRVAGQNHANVILCDRFVVADVYRHQYDEIGPATDDEARANARLIAAAPELLEACKAAVFGANHIDCVRAMQEVLPRIRAAIAKAGGAK